MSGDHFLWNHDIAYVIGLIATDGSLSKDGRHIDFSSKDIDQIKNFARALHLKNKIGRKTGGYNPKGIYYRIQFGNVKLYRFLLSIGLMPNKSKMIGKLDIPDEYFSSFLRGNLDGDGYTYSYRDYRWKHSYQIYLGLVSASKDYIYWLRSKIRALYGLEGSIKQGKSVFVLEYSKKATIALLQNIYYKDTGPYLRRKKDKIDKALQIINAEMLELVDRHA